MNICDFCDRYGIKYFGISLKIGNGKKTPEYVPLYKATPKMTDFKTLSLEQLKERQENVELFDYIAMDTSEYHHIDIDYKDGEEYDTEATEWVENISELSPFFKSMTKSRGKHIIIKSDNGLGKNNRPQSIFKDIEFLNGQWSFVKRSEKVYNSDSDIYDFDDDDIKEFIQTVPTIQKVSDDGYSSGTVTPIINDTKLAQVLNLIPPEDYDTWTRCVWALKNDGEHNYELAKEWSKRSNKYEEDAFEKLWENGRHGVTLGTVYFLANKIAPELYRRFYIKTSLSNNDDALADTFIKLQNDNVIYSNETVYIYKKNWISERPKNCLQLKKLVRETLHEYILNVEIDFNKSMIGKSEAEQRDMKATKDLIKKIFDKVSTRSQIDNITAFVLQDLASMNHNIEFDLGEEQYFNLHFRNGVYELDNKRFRKRTQSDYITQFLDWDYNENVDSTILNELREFYGKIQPDKSQYKFMLQWLGYGLTGSVKHQKFKMNIGYSASNGKSTEFKIHDKVFPIYTMKLDNKTFQHGYSKRHKQIIHLVQRPVRFAYCEELENKKLDSDFLKEIVDGANINCEVMYGTSTTKTIQAKISTCSNKDFNLEGDQGVMRRGLVQNYTSQFKEEYKEDNFQTHKYSKIKDYEKRFSDDKYKNAYLQLLIENYDIDFNVPKSNEEQFKQILEEYDEVGSVLSGIFELTGEDSDRISKNEMLALVNEKLSGKKLEWRELLSEMKKKGVQYSRQKRSPDGEQGCFIGIKRTEYDEEECDDI
jgi:phage/plasmid-associated DNA primase